MQASQGRTVFYAAVTGDGTVVQLAATVARVVDDVTVNLWVFPDGVNDLISEFPFIKRGVQYGGPQFPGSWYWPPRVG